MYSDVGREYGRNEVHWETPLVLARNAERRVFSDHHVGILVGWALFDGLTGYRSLFVFPYVFSGVWERRSSLGNATNSPHVMLKGALSGSSRWYNSEVGYF